MPRFTSIDHHPQGDPCTKCWYPAISHRVYHISVGDPCDKCGLPASRHRGYSKERYEKTRSLKAYRFLGIDGEGQGRDDHKYIMMGASSEDGTFTSTIEAYDNDRLRTSECLDFLLSLPSEFKLFSYSFSYDLTKILTDVDNETIYYLVRPELRQRHGKDAFKGPIPVKWDRYMLNLQGTKFTVKRGRKRVVIWDIFKFYQSKFVSALKDWKVGTPELWERMSKMKDKRSEFDKESRASVRAYMLEECACMAALARKLVQAHEQAGLELKTFYGAGSSGAAMLNVMGVREKNAPVIPEMKEAVASAFFGGRFENSVIGAIRERVFNYDISSAYPYHTTFLPCLVHGTWRHTTKRDDLDASTVALVSYTLGSKPKLDSWGPFPFRDREGSICFPIESGGGWIWRDEYLQGERIFPHVQFREAWIYQTQCDCRPFERLPKYYVHRILLGKEGPGIVIKLAVNSVYGKLAQSVGNAVFSSWIWAGMITSGCRAQVLQALSLHKDWSNLLMVATDGIYTRERLSMPLPLDTGTADAVTAEGKRANKPLGGWEEKIVDKGIFVARPGIYFPLDPTPAELKDIRGRGVGKGTVLNNWQKIIDAWEKGGVNGSITVANVSRFCGAKTCIHRSDGHGYQRAIAFDGIAPSYGNWIGRRIEMGFDPMPKRSGINPDGVTLALRTIDRGLRSMPYDAAMISREAAEMKTATDEILEQPDADLAEYEVDFDGN